MAILRMLLASLLEFPRPATSSFDAVVHLLCSCRRAWIPFCFRSFQKIMDPSVVRKPPNILVYTGEDASQDTYNRNIVGNLRFCVNPESYIVYRISPSELIKDPWVDNAAALVVSLAKNSPEVTPEIAERFECYGAEGPILNFCTKLGFPKSGVKFEKIGGKNIAFINYKEWKNVAVLKGCLFECDPSCFEELAHDQSGAPVIFKSKDSRIVLSSVHLEIDPAVASSEKDTFSALSSSNQDRLSILRDILSSHLGLNCEVQDLPKLTPCFLFVKGGSEDAEMNLFTMKLNLRKPEIFFVDCNQTNQLPEASDSHLPVYVNAPDNLHAKLFDKEKFFKALRAKSFGHRVFYVDVVGTTMDLVENLLQFEKSVIIASIQTRGKGRGRNQWISPYGCAAFSTYFRLSLSSRLGGSLSLIQQLVTLAVVVSIRKCESYKNLDIRMKWPNDIYYGNKCKIGGVLVNCSIQGNDVKVFMGCGVNVSNSKPTMCLNDVVHFCNQNSETKLPDMSREELIAFVLNELEELIDDFQANGPDKVYSLIYSYWLHSGQTVTIDSLQQKGTIVGLDEYGYLLVKTESGKTVSLQPDGNSFDMLRNLICLKQL